MQKIKTIGWDRAMRRAEELDTERKKRIMTARACHIYHLRSTA